MSRGRLRQRFLFGSAFLFVASITIATAQTDPRTADLEAALAANQGNASLQSCLQNDSSVDAFRRAVTAIERSRDPNVPASFNCSGIGASWQQVAPAACCSVFERDKGRNVDAAWVALQQCGWRAELEKRRPAYVAAANKCLAAAGVLQAVARPAQPAEAQPDPWRDVPTFDQIRGRILGQEAFAVLGGAEWHVFDNAGRLRPIPGFLADRIQPGYTILNDRAWLQAALASFRTNMKLDDFVAWMARGAADAGKQYVWFGDEFVRHQLPDTSVRTMGGQFCSSEHSSVRGTINGGGDFIYCPLWEELRVPMGAEKTYWDAAGEQFLKLFLPAEIYEQLKRDVATDIARVSPQQPATQLATWPMRAGAPRHGLTFVAARQAAPRASDQRVRVDLPTASVTSEDPLPIIITDVSPSGAAAVIVLAGRVRITDTRTGHSTLAARGQAVLVWPGTGVSSPVAISAERWASAARPRIRGSIVLRPGERWTGALQLQDLLAVESRLLWNAPAGGAYALSVAINGTPLATPLLNKTSPMRYADGRSFPYREPDSARWMVFYSRDYEANKGPSGGIYEVKTDPGQAYRYVWDVASLLGGNRTAQVEFRNALDAGGAPLELRLLPTDLYELVERAKRGGSTPAPEYTTTAVPPRTGTTALPSGPSSAPGQPHLAIYTVPRILAHGDFDYPVVVQLQDGSGRPLYPPAPLTVTVTSQHPNIVALYMPNRPASTTITLRPPDRSGSGGLSWDKVQVIAARNDVAGTATITATAPGFPGASVTVTTVPTRTPDNRSAPAQSAPAASVSLTVIPPIVETDRRPVISMDLLDARGDPTGVALGPGEWTLESANASVFPAYSSSGRTASLSPQGPGQALLTLRSKRPGITGGSATLFVVTPGGAPVTTESATSPPAAGTTGQVVPRADFGEPAGPSGRISNIVTARGVRNGAAVDVTDTFTPDVNPIHVWFRLSGFAPGTILTSRWTYLGGAAPLVIGTGEFTVAPGNDYGTFSYELAPGKRWPAGNYRIEILLDRTVVGSATFVVSGGYR